jgi:N utilization substance protein A
VASGAVAIKAIAREPGSRSKLAVAAADPHIDPVGALVGQRGVRVSTVMSELGGEKIDVIEWSENPEHFIEDALSPAKVISVEITDEENRQAVVTVTEDQQSLAIGRGGQNVRLAAKLTGWRIDIRSAGSHDETTNEAVDDTIATDTTETVSSADTTEGAADETENESTENETADSTPESAGSETETESPEEKTEE